MTTPWAAGSIPGLTFGASYGAGHQSVALVSAFEMRPGTAASKVSSMRAGSARVHPNKRLKLTAHVGVFDLSPVRCSLRAVR